MRTGIVSRVELQLTTEVTHQLQHHHSCHQAKLGAQVIIARVLCHRRVGPVRARRRGGRGRELGVLSMSWGAVLVRPRFRILVSGDSDKREREGRRTCCHVIGCVAECSSCGMGARVVIEAEAPRWGAFLCRWGLYHWVLLCTKQAGLGVSEK